MISERVGQIIVNVFPTANFPHLYEGITGLESGRSGGPLDWPSSCDYKKVDEILSYSALDTKIVKSKK
ncbi:MAG: hypothetical protein IPH20_20235 [Bacteroidales bacterium]|nr:hypothetical protein [Bacteroidales bacterium]